MVVLLLGTCYAHLENIKIITELGKYGKLNKHTYLIIYISSVGQEKLI